MKIIECPRDAMQGIEEFIPTKAKTDYINELLKIGFNTIDFGSFVSPKAIPQMKDTGEVLSGLELSTTSSKLLAIVANVRGASDACLFDEISYLGYPLSLSETFQQRNTNRSIENAFEDLIDIQNLCVIHNKTLVVYLSMGFGNPYGDPYEMDYVEEFVTRLDSLGVKIISLSDTIGVADVEKITTLFHATIPKFRHIEFGAHLHSRSEAVYEKVSAAYKAGCRRIDGAIKGFGGCPMAEDKLVGNMATEKIVSCLEILDVQHGLNLSQLKECVEHASGVFGS